jgi:hypothetical protein
LRFGAEKIFKETGPTPDDGLVGSSMNGANSTGAPGLSPAEDANGEEGRVLEVDDIDELCPHAGGVRRRVRSCGTEPGRQLTERIQIG